MIGNESHYEQKLGLLVMVVAGIPVDAQLGPEVPTHDTGANIGRFAIIGGMGCYHHLSLLGVGRLPEGGRQGTCRDAGFTAPSCRDDSRT